MNPYQYPGEELDLFSEAIQWKRYLKKNISPYLKGNVLEVGAGFGATTNMLYSPQCTSWTALEPDATLYRRLAARAPRMGSGIEALQGDLTTLAGRIFSSILYIDVLEHIEADRQEANRAADLLTGGGYLIVLAPAFPFLYTPFDAAIGHFRRYTRASLGALQPPGCRRVQSKYLDSLGFFASCANKLFLRQKYPTRAQVRFWDRRLVPLSRGADTFLHPFFGKSVLTVWQKEGSA